MNTEIGKRYEMENPFPHEEYKTTIIRFKLIGARDIETFVGPDYKYIRYTYHRPIEPKELMWIDQDIVNFFAHKDIDCFIRNLSSAKKEVTEKLERRKK